MNIGEKLKALRREKRLTLEDVSKSVDISRANINKYENGNITNIPSDKIEALARYYDVSPAYLLHKEDGFFFASITEPRFPLFFNGFEVYRSVPLCLIIVRCYSFRYS